MKVFGIGLSRTGTRSLATALNRLGIPAVHYPDDSCTRSELLQGRRRLSVLDRVDGIVDLQAAAFYRTWVKSYPSAKFILTTRTENEWLASVEKHYRGIERDWSDFDEESKLFVRFLAECAYGTFPFERERFRRAFRQHEANVRTDMESGVGAFLILNICGGEGWDELCPFLGRHRPPLSFPHEGSS